MGLPFLSKTLNKRLLTNWPIFDNITFVTSNYTPAADDSWKSPKGDGDNRGTKARLKWQQYVTTIQINLFSNLPAQTVIRKGHALRCFCLLELPPFEVACPE